MDKIVEQKLRGYVNNCYDYCNDHDRFACIPNGQCCVSKYTVYDLIERMLNNEVFKNKVLIKLANYVSESQKYLSGQHLKPERFEYILSKLKLFIEINKNHQSNGKCLPYVIDFKLKKNSWEISTIIASALYEKNNKIVSSAPGETYDYRAIIFDSIVNQSAIDKFGEDGFVAMLIVFIEEDSIINHQSLSIHSIAKHYAELINGLFDNDINQFNIEFTCIPKYLHDKWYFRKYLNEIVQIYLFNEYDNGNGYCIKYRDNNSKHIESKRWYRILHNISYTETMEFPDKKISQKWKYNRDLEVSEIIDSKY